MYVKISNLSPLTAAPQLRRLFMPFGDVDSASLDCDKFNGRPRGTALVMMPVDKQALLAIASLDNTVVDGRKIRVERDNRWEA